MAERFQRAQILLDPKQHQALTQIARREKRSLSDVVRAIVQQYLQERAVNIRKQREMEALEQLNAIRAEMSQTYGVYPGDLVAEARAEREAQAMSIQGGEGRR
jgi:hypothetical protein